MNPLYVHFSVEVSGDSSPTLFAEKVAAAFPEKEELRTLRESSIPAELPVTFRLKKARASDSQNYLQISYSDVAGEFEHGI